MIRHQVRTEYRIAFPYLFNSRPRSVHMTPYHYPSLYYVKADDPDLPAYYFDPIINPVSAFRTTKGNNYAESDEMDLEDLIVPEDFAPILDELPLYTDTTSLGIALYWAPRPFNMRSGLTRRAIDVPLINRWFHEHCPPEYPVKVRVSYQKLLKYWVLNQLHHRKPKAVAKKVLFKALKITKFFQST